MRFQAAMGAQSNARRTRRHQDVVLALTIISHSA
jgi:hypothetical protein